jgi:hypothetical protein
VPYYTTYREENFRDIKFRDARLWHRFVNGLKGYLVLHEWGPHVETAIIGKAAGPVETT